jgi:hypothetical protein
MLVRLRAIPETELSCVPVNVETTAWSTSCTKVKRLLIVVLLVSFRT